MNKLLQMSALMALAATMACHDRTSRPDSWTITAPSPQPPPAAPTGPTSPVRISGVATDDDGAPVAGAMIEVTVNDSISTSRRLYAVTNSAGFYELTADVLVARSPDIGHIKADSPGRERFFDYLAGSPTVTRNVPLYRITRIAAGESVRVTIRPGDSTCGHGDELTCRTVRVTVPTTGRLSMTCEPRGDDNGGPGLTIVGYNDRTASGEPWRVVAGEAAVEVGMWSTSTVSQSCLLTTTFSSGS